MKFINYGINNGTFTAQYTLNTSIDAPTEIYFNQDVYYKNGYRLSVFYKFYLMRERPNKSQKNYLKF